MKTWRTRISAFALACLFVAGPSSFAAETNTLTFKGAADTVSPRANTFSYLTSLLEITSGMASCTGKVTVSKGYTANITMELYRDEVSIKSWNLDGQTGTFGLSKDYFVTSGHTYQVIVSVDVYNSSGKLIEQATKESALVKY